MSTFAKTTGKSIQDAFNKFHYDNPMVYAHFKKMALFAIVKKKKTRISSKLICNVIRWNLFMETKEATLFEDKDGVKHKFKINDAYTSRYVRVFINEFPQYANHFYTKELRSA